MTVQTPLPTKKTRKKFQKKRRNATDPFFPFVNHILIYRPEDLPILVSNRIFVPKFSLCSQCKRGVELTDARRYKIRFPNQLTLDHITPLCRGGSNNKKNLQILCFECHEKKTFLENSEKKI